MTTNVLTHFSEALAAAVAYAGDSIVRVEARRRGHASGIAWSDDGLVLTADHAVQRDHDLRIGLPDEAVVDAELVGRDPTTDIALLRADAALHPPAWAEPDTLKVGHLVLSVGRHDAHAQASLGIIAKRDAAWRTPHGGRVDAFIQTDIAIYPGFSGSALVNAEGQACGMNTSWFQRRSSLTLPPATLRRVVGLLLEHGHIRRGWLGVAAQPVRLPRALAEERDQATGLLVVAVEAGGPAETAGLYVGDLLVALDDEPLLHLDTLLWLLTGDRAGQDVALTVARGGHVETLTITIGERNGIR